MVLLALLLLAVAAAGSSAAAIRVDVPATDGALEAAQLAVREHIRRRPDEDIEVTLLPGVHRLTQALTFGPEDSGEAGRFRVKWTAAKPNATVFDGGLPVPGPWTPEETLGSSGGGGATSAIWSAPLPTALLKHAKTIRQLYVGGERYARTRTPSKALGIPNHATITSEGFRMASLEPLSWRNPDTVEVVSDHTWVQHRCPITSIAKLDLPPPPPAPPIAKGTCEWSPKTKGHSPGSSLKRLSAGSYADCQQACCHALPQCEGIIYNTENCYLLDRKYEHGFMPDGGGFVADLNCTAEEPPSCPGVPPPLPQPTIMNVSALCFQVAIRPGALALALGNLVRTRHRVFGAVFW